MALLYIDGFDTYRNASQMNQGGYWRNAFFVSNSTAEQTYLTNTAQGRFSGQAVLLDEADLVLPVAKTQLFLGVAIQMRTISGVNDTLIISMADGNGVYFGYFSLDRATGLVRLFLKNASSSYVAVASSNSGLFGLNEWNYWEFSILNSTTVGAAVVRINGVTVLNATGLNTAQYAGTLLNTGLFRFDAANGSTAFDDLYLCDASTGAGTYPNNGFLGDKRVDTLFVDSVNSSQFTQTPTPTNINLWTLYNPANLVENVTFPANTVVVAQQFAYAPYGVQIPTQGNWAAPQDLNLTSVQLGVAVLTPSIQIKCMVYSEDPASAGRPKDLVGTSVEVTALAAGMNTFTFSPPLALNKKSQYFFGFISNAAVSLRANYNTTVFNSLSPLFDSWTGYAQTYGAPPAVFNWAGGTGRFENKLLELQYNFECDSAGNVNETYCDNGATYNYSSTVGDVDTFNTDGTLSSNSIVYGVQVNSVVTKDDAGVRSACNVIRSGASEALGASNSLGTTYVGYNDVFAVDPNTSASWTPAAVNAAKIGYKVVS